jgi:hypothetical protein
MRIKIGDIEIEDASIDEVNALIRSRSISGSFRQQEPKEEPTKKVVFISNKKKEGFKRLWKERVEQVKEILAKRGAMQMIDISKKLHIEGASATHLQNILLKDKDISVMHEGHKRLFVLNNGEIILQKKSEGRKVHEMKNSEYHNFMKQRLNHYYGLEHTIDHKTAFMMAVNDWNRYKHGNNSNNIQIHPTEEQIKGNLPTIIEFIATKIRCDSIKLRNYLTNLFFYKQPITQINYNLKTPIHELFTEVLFNERLLKEYFNVSQGRVVFENDSIKLID